MPVSPAKRKQGVVQAVMAPPPPTVDQSYLFAGVTILVQDLEAGACGSNGNRDTEKAAKDSPAMTLRVTDWCSRRQSRDLGWSLCHLPCCRARSEGGWDKGSENQKAVFCSQGMFLQQSISYTPAQILPYGSAALSTRRGLENKGGLKPPSSSALEAAGDWLVPGVGSHCLRLSQWQEIARK